MRLHTQSNEASSTFNVCPLHLLGACDVALPVGLCIDPVPAGVKAKLDDELAAAVPVKPYVEAFPDSDGTGNGGAEANLGRMAPTPGLEVKAKMAKASKRMVVLQQQRQNTNLRMR